MRFTHRFCDFFEKKQICCVQGREFAPFSLLYNSRKKIMISPNCEFYKSSLYTETNENQNEKISDVLYRI